MPISRRALSILALLVAGCVPPDAIAPLSSSPRAPANAVAPAPTVSPRTEEEPAPVLVAPRPLVELPVPGHADAVVALPQDGRRPVLVATHGAGGTPEAQCAYWQELLKDAAFVLCPRGVTMDVNAPPADRGYFYSTHPALEREVRDALAALAARYPDRVDLDRAVYTGYSQGGTMGALAFGVAPSPFTALVLVEGGSEEWSTYTARSFKAGGGRRVLFACGRRSCADAARRSATLLRKASVDNRVVDASGAGHTYYGAVRDGIVEALPWLFEGDARFEPPGQRN